MPTDAELEAEAERERNKSRIEAELILTREAMERKLAEERGMTPPTRAQTMPNPPSPSSSPGWWTAAKNRLSTKEKDLTPAQQVIQETKARDKKAKRDWPTTPDRSPTPRHAMAPNLTPSPRRSAESPKSEPLPIYAQFDSTGALDVHVTLLTIAKRFEKLEKWTVGHVRALEERMSDVERWLVEKEEKQPNENEGPTRPIDANEMSDLRDEINELSSRMGELGREMARMATAPANLSSGPSRQSAEIATGGYHESMKSSSAEHELGIDTEDAAFFSSMGITTSPTSATGQPFKAPTARQSTSPPLSTKFSSAGSRSKLPYPSGDYATPPDSKVAPSSPTQAIAIPGLPAPGGTGLGLSSSVGSSYSSVSFSTVSSIEPPVKSSPSTRPLPTPSPAPGRFSSVSPSPTPRNRKRYTVALGGPIVPPEEEEDEASTAARTNEEEDEENVFADETIGKKASRSLQPAIISSRPPYVSNRSGSISPSPVSGSQRVRAQSTYGPSALHTPLELTSATLGSGGKQTPPLRIRSRSSERLFSRDYTKEKEKEKGFVDPLVLRRQQEVKRSTGFGGPGGGTNGGIGANVLSKGKGKVPIEELVKFFDGERKR